MKNSNLAAAAVALAVVGLSLGDALTGHGIKGNKNLNPMVVGTGSSSSSSSSSGGSDSSTASGDEDDGESARRFTEVRNTTKDVRGEWSYDPEAKRWCRSVDYEVDVKCSAGGVLKECTPRTLSFEGTECTTSKPD